MSIGYDGLKDLFKEKYDKYMNLFWGAVSFFSGIVILIFYLMKL